MPEASFGYQQRLSRGLIAKGQRGSSGWGDGGSRYYQQMVTRREVDPQNFNSQIYYPYSLRQLDFQLAMQDIYDFFHDMNVNLRSRSLRRFEDMSRPAMLSGMLSDMLTDSLAKHSRSLVVNAHFNGHPDLLENGKYPRDSVSSGEHGVEIKSTKKPGGAVDTHGARDQWMCVFVYKTDSSTEPVDSREALRFTEVYLGRVTVDDFRSNGRGPLGTRTATLDALGIAKLRKNWVYLDR